MIEALSRCIFCFLVCEEGRNASFRITNLIRCGCDCEKAHGLENAIPV